MKWITEQDRIEIKDNFSQGCLGGILAAVGLIFAGIGGVVGFFMLDDLNVDALGMDFQKFSLYIQKNYTSLIHLLFPIIFIIIGLIFLLLAARYFRQSKQAKVIIDLASQRVRYDINAGKDGYEFSFGEVLQLYTIKEVRTSSNSSGNSSYTVYVVQIVKIDGAVFWLDTLSSSKSFTEKVKAILNLTGFALQDDSGLIGSQEASQNYQKRMPSLISDYSPAVAINNTGLGTRIEMRKKGSLFGAILGGLAMLLFLLIPAVIMLLAFRTDNLGFKIGFSFFMTIFYIILLFGVVVGLKKYIIEISGNRLTILLKFKLSFLDGLFGKKIEIDQHSIKTIRLNRKEGLGFQLSVGINPPIEMNRMSTILFNAGAFSKKTKPLANTKRSAEQEIGLWTLSPTIPGNGPMLNDLVYLESFLQDTLRIQED